MEGGTLAALGRLEGITPSRLWTHLDPEVRTLAARSFYAHDWGDGGTRREADLAIAQTLRFREASVRKLTVEKRVEYLARAVRPSDTLAHSLLLALHLEQRRPLLAAFLDELGVPHHDGLIAEDHDMTAPDPQPLRRAASQLLQRFPPHEVEVYFATLLTMDAEVWAPLAEILSERGKAEDGPLARRT